MTDHDPVDEPSALDEQGADLPPSDVTDILDGTPGALERANEAREQGRRGDTILLEEL
jgi:hypothetical protein